MAESLGARLRQQREGRQIALVTVAEQTKIKLSLLEALERDDVSHWPTGIFRRAFVRAYAHAIGLDPDSVIREFLELHPDPDETIETLSATLSGTQVARTHAAPPTRLRTILDSAIGSLSRRRQGPAAEDLVVVRAEPDHPAAAEPPVESGRAATTAVAAADGPPATVPPPSEPDLPAVARLCTELGLVESADQVPSLLQEAARLLDATGLIVWLWDAGAAELKPALAHGYSARVLAQLPAVPRDADNATAAAFRSCQTCVINGGDRANGALAVPLLTPAGCAGVLALELQHGGERAPSVQAVATILAAVLAQLTGGAQPAEARQGDSSMRRASGEAG